MNEAILAHETQIRALEEAIKQDEASMSLVN